MKRNIWLFGVIGVLFAVIGGYVGTRTTGVQSVPVTTAPAVTSLFAQSMADANGGTAGLAHWKGKPMVVNFWATWCGPCVQEMPELSALQLELAPKKVQIVGIGIDSPSNIKEFASKYKIAYPLYVAGMSGTELSRQFGNQGGGLPFTVLLSSDGRVVKTYLGKLKMDELRRDISAL
ncbi:MAG: TlpA family protein disulfide reductase [Herminiimonas sp.]|nr:TlpA family protein disulfide reductase [Herminiimonas sp.]